MCARARVCVCVLCINKKKVFSINKPYCTFITGANRVWRLPAFSFICSSYLGGFGVASTAVK